MIVSIDGNTYLGKTRFISVLKNLYHWESVEEYDTDVDYLETLDNYKRQEYYFQLECGRKKAKKNEKKILDRSYISFFAHAYAVDCMESQDLFQYTLLLLEKNMNENVMQMDKMVFFVQNGKYERYDDIYQKGGQAILYNDTYRKLVDEFYYVLSDVLKREGLLSFRLALEGEEITEEFAYWLAMEPIQSAEELSKQTFRCLESLITN